MKKFHPSTLEHPVMNAAGVCKTTDDVRILANSFASAIIVGSYTLVSREDNEEPRYYEHWEDGVLQYTLNSLGLPNKGLPGMVDNFPAMLMLAHNANKHLLVSIAGFTPDEYGILARRAGELGADGIEVNCGCPNVWRGGRQKQPVSYCFDDLVNVCFEVKEALVDFDIPWWVKSSPHCSEEGLSSFAKAITYAMAGGVTAVNTFGIATHLHQNGRAATTPNGGIAGMGGKALKPIGLANVRELRRLLPPDFFIIGCGGITTVNDVFDYMRSGAGAVQVASAYMAHKQKIFFKLGSGYLEIMLTAE